MVSSVRVVVMEGHGPLADFPRSSYRREAMDVQGKECWANTKCRLSMPVHRPGPDSASKSCIFWNEYLCHKAFVKP